MPRVERVTQQVSRLVQTRNANTGGPYTVYSNSVSPVEYISDITRGDVVTSPVLNGFRKPLAYVASGVTAEFPAIFADALYQNTANPPTRRDILITGYHTGLVEPRALQNFISSADKNRAVVNMLRAVGDSKWSAGEMIAEMQSSIDMIAKSARTLSNAMFAALRRNWRGVAKALNVDLPKIKKGATTADGWLSFNFGWAPVVSDIANSAAFLSGAYDTVDPPIIMARTRLADRRVYTTQSQHQIAWGSGLIYFPYEDLDEVSEEWQASVYFKLDVSFFRGLSQYGLLGFSTPWAILPMSYIADWVLPIGDYLEAIDATMGLSYLGGSNTSFRRSKKTRSYGSVTGGNLTTVRSGSAFAAPVNRFDMARSVYASVPSPVPAYVKNPFDVFKAVTSVALLRQFSSKQ